MVSPSLRARVRHLPPLFGIEQLVEMRVPRIHARGTNRFDVLLGQLGGGEAAAAFAKAFKLLVFVWVNEIAGDLAVARNGDGFTLSAHPIAAEVAGELGSRDSFGGVHESSLSMGPIYVNYANR